MIDWEATHRRVAQLLQTERCPWHYKMLFHKTVIGQLDDYGDKTDPAEKFRQHYADNQHNDVAFVPGGWLVLHSWFPTKQQLKLFPPSPVMVRGDCIISYEAGFEQASRQPFMYDHFNDAKSAYRQERRQRAALVECHVKHFFEANYPEYYSHPSNHEKYDKPAKEDFFLRLPGKPEMKLDVKSWSYENNNGQKTGVARNVKDDIIYLWGDWNDEQSVAMYGICSGKWLNIIGQDGNGLTHISDNHIWPIDCLLVMLNMARANQNYSQFRRDIETERSS